MECRNLKHNSAGLIYVEKKGFNMRSFFSIFLALLFSGLAVAEPGINEIFPIDGTPIISLSYENESEANKDFPIEILVDEESASNGTVFSWTTQICINSGVCYSPQTTDLSLDSQERKWTGSVLVDDEASYVNWRIDIEWPDGNFTTIPESGFGWKVWSKCWYDTETDQWGGSDSEKESCVEGNSEVIPGFGAEVFLLSSMMAALMARRF